MTEPQPTEVRRACVVGTGLIGARWAALFLARGLEVVATDPAPSAEERLRNDIERAWPALEQLGLTQDAWRSGLRFERDLVVAVGDADFIQESTPDDDALKVEVIRRIDAACSPHAVIASSTSGILPTLLQSRCARPERVLVGHPFNPVHILPLVEVVAGRDTSPAVVDRAMEFYRWLGKRPLRVRKEAPGFVSNRLQEALWREMFHLVDDGIASTAELDAAMSDGPGLRLALFGPAFVYYLQGGTGGMAYALSQFNPARIPDWSHNYYPEITPELVRLLDEQTREQADGRSLDDWERLRDDFLVRALKARDELMAAEEKAEPTSGD